MARLDRPKRKNLSPFEFVKLLNTEVDDLELEVVAIDGKFDSPDLITEGSGVALVATGCALD
jgi:hypothetical protein